MNGPQGSGSPPRSVSRLVYGYAAGRHHGARRTAFEIAAARSIDDVMARLRLARPAVLVSGFWRSGTTWLQESLAAALGGKTVFEPLSPLEPRRGAAMARLHPDDSEDVRQATIPGPEPQESAFWAHLDRACTGEAISGYELSCRRDVAESFRRAIVLKDVRLQANLAAFHRRYGVPIVHLRRHPCAVVASLRTSDWHWSFARAPLAILLPRLGAAVAEAERAAAAAFDTDAVSRTAAFWATTERLAQAALRGQPWGLTMSYEDFVAAPDAALARIGAAFGLRRKHHVDFSMPSASIDPAAFAAQGSRAAEGWRGQLTGADIGRVEAAVETIFPDWRAEASAGRGPPGF